MPDTPVSVPSALAEAKRVADGLQFATRMLGKTPDFTACGGPAAEAYWDYFNPARISSLVAAVEAALKAADDWDAEAAGSLLEEINDVQQKCAIELREAIGAALTGKENGDER